MVAKFNSFFADEDGAITVNWVVMTAACMSLALGTMALMSDSVRDNGTATSAMMETYEISYEFDTTAANAEVTAIDDPDPAPVN